MQIINNQLVDQVVGGVPSHRRSRDLMAVPDGASDSLRVQLGLLCGRVRGGVQPVCTLLRGGGSTGDPYPPTALFQESVELLGRAHCGGGCPKHVIN